LGTITGANPRAYVRFPGAPKPGAHGPEPTASAPSAIGESTYRGLLDCSRMTRRFDVTRRAFLKTGSLVSAGLFRPSAAFSYEGPEGKAASKLGLDNFSVRAMGWKVPELIDYAASLAADSLFITDLDAFESFDPSYLATLRQRASARRVQVHVGTWSICPTSKAFKPKWGTAEEHLALAIGVAKGVGSPVIRVVLGTWEDRLTDGGIERHMEETAKVCRTCRSRAQDAGVKIAIENHAGDMHSTEVVRLIEAAGREYVGANLDSGNALWTLEDPIDSLEVLGPLALTTSLRDSAVWKSEHGARVQWTAMGEGDIDLKAYFARFRVLCPGVPVHIETISGFSRDFPYLQPEFWKAWPNMPARSLARFVALAERGRPREAWQPPAGEDRTKAEQAYQRGELERSLIYCRGTLGLGTASRPA
jgi:sugar phosphate isomerase/epimerase